MSPRLTLALETGELMLPQAGNVLVMLPTPDAELAGLEPSGTEILQPFRPYFDFFQGSGFACVTEKPAACAVAIVCLPRAKAQARALVFDACRLSTGLVVIDGSKTDGIGSIYKDIRRRVEVSGQLTKAHGRIFWFEAAQDDFADWQAPDTQSADGFVTAPGLFSADGIDPASRLLAGSLPVKMGRHVVDLGAGWGYLASEILARDAKITTLDLVEADHIALGCAQRNVTDPRAKFHWRDALDWAADGRIDTVVMNPPFHKGRATDASLGRGFIATAARILAPNGELWMVANRHLPYEAALDEHFVGTEEIAGDNRFKVLRAKRPKNKASGKRADPSLPSRSRRTRAKH